MNKRRLVSRTVLFGGALIIVQALIHSVLGFQLIATGLARLPQETANLHYWSWLAAGFMLLYLGLLAIYTSAGLRQGKSWALVISIATGLVAFIVLITPVFIRIGYPLTGIIGSVLLLVPLLWGNEFRES